MIDFSGNTGGGGGTVISKIVCTSAANTPLGVTWNNGSETVTGTLAASAAVKDNIYYVPGKKTKTGNIYTEYSCLLSDGSYVWEQTGNADLNLDGYLQKGNNTLTANHILVTDSAGNVADSGKTTADLQDVIYGYLHEGTFYVESAHTTAITPSTTKQYVDMTTATAPAPYMWNGTAYVANGGGMSADHENILASALTDLDERVRSAEHGWLSRGRAMVFSDVINNRTSVASLQPVSAYMMYLQKKEADENERVLGAALCDLFVKTMAQTIIAPEYSTSQSTYSVGDYRTFENNLYKCNTAISEAEFFNPAKWTLTSVMAEISTLLANS